MNHELVRSVKHHLPVALTPFVGRVGETAQLIDQLSDSTCRLVTIVGPGGVGKTRLAVEVSQQLLSAPDHALPFPQGVYFVPLAALATGEHIDNTLATAIAGVLEIPLSGPDTPALQVQYYLRERAVLLVL